MFDLVSLRQAAKELRCAERIIRSAVRNGELHGYRLGERTVRVDREELQKWVRSRRLPTWRD